LAVIKPTKALAAVCLGHNSSDIAAQYVINALVIHKIGIYSWQTMLIIGAGTYSAAAAALELLAAVVKGSAQATAVQAPALASAVQSPATAGPTAA